MIFCVLLLSALLNIGAAPALEEPIQTARSQFDSSNYAAAVRTLTNALGQSPQDSSLHYWLARSYYEMRDYDNAVQHAEMAVKLGPQNAEYNRWLGRAYGGKAEQSHSFFLARKVKQAFEAAVNLAPRSIEARRDLMQYLVEAPWIVGGDKEKAKLEIASISKLDTVQGHLARAAYLSADKKWKEAEIEYLAAVDQHPARIEPYIEAAQFFAARKDAANLDRVVSRAGALN